MITKQKFVEIINKLQEVNDFVEETNSRARKLNDAIISDFFNAMSLSITHESLVVELLESIFNDTETLSWWIYELDYGKRYIKGCMQEEIQGEMVDIDVSTPEKLYDYLVEHMQ